MEKISVEKRIPLYLSGLLGIAIGALVVLEPFVLKKAGLEESVFLIWDHYIPLVGGSIVAVLIGAVLIAKKYLGSRQNRDAFLFLVLMATPFFTAFSSILVHPTFTLLVLMLSVWFMRGVVENHIDIVFNRSFIILILFYLSAAFALLLGPNPEFGQFFKIFFLFFPIFCLINLIRSQNQLLQCFDYLFIFAFLSCLIGIGQLAGIISAFSSDYSDAYTNTIVGIRIVKMTGFFISADTFINAISLCVLISGYFLISFKGLPRRKKYYYLSFCITGLIVIFLSHIRMAWISLAVCGFLILLLKKPRWTLHYAIAIILAGFIGYFSGIIPNLYEKMYFLRPDSVNFRGVVNQIAIETIMDHPLTGVGLSAIRYHNNATDGVPHILWLQLGAGMGIITTFLCLIYVASLLVRVVHRMRREAEGPMKIFFQAGLLGLVYIMIVSLLSPDLFEKIFWFYYALLESALFIAREGQEKMARIKPIFGIY